MNCSIKESCGQQDYRTYRLSKKECMKYAGMGFVIAVFVLYFFYKSIWVIWGGVPCAFFYCRWKKRQLCEKRRYTLEQEFKDWICIVDLGLQAGYSIENAFLKAGREIRLLHHENSMIQREAYRLEQQLNNHVTLEKILWDFGERSGSEDIQNFAEVFVVGKRSGANIREMITGCCEIIIQKMEVEREIQMLIHGKVMEQKIMCLVPFAIISYINLSSPGYFTPLYHNPAGICIMTMCLSIYLFSIWLSLRIIKIEV